MQPQRFRVCTICRKDILFGAEYFRCSVSTCNTGKLAQYFCSLNCFSAHVPGMRHKDAWAEPTRAPNEEESPGASEPAAPERRRVVTPTAAPSTERATPPAEEVNDGEVLVVVSKVKAYVRARSGMNTSDGVMAALSVHLRRCCDAAIRRAAQDGRKTVMDRDFDF